MHVEIRNVGRKKKYYLAHSFRHDGKVKKFRFYLGTDLTKTELNDKIKHAKEILDERIKAYGKVGDPFYTVITSKELEYVKHLEDKYRMEEIKVLHLSEKNWAEFTKAFTYDTNAIEGSTVTFTEVSDILEKKEWPKEKQKWEISETYGVAEAVDFIRNSREDISLKLIKELHRIVFKNSKDFAGKFRKNGEEVAVVDAFGNIKHRGAPSSQIVRLLNELIRWYGKNNRKYPALVLAAVVHNHFETIHPFKDGNGRVGRLLLNNILLKHGLPPVNMELKSRQEYYRALQEYQKMRNLRPMIELILREYRRFMKSLNR